MNTRAPRSARPANRPFHLISKPTGPLCNIACDYCFYLEKEHLFAQKRRWDYAMSDAVLEAFVRQYIAAQPPGTEEVNFAWQGGEPTLLGTDFYERALRYQRKYARAGMHISNAIQTNGTMVTRERARWFADHNFLVGVSIDGPEDLHNRFRTTRLGRGTFGDVMEGINNLRAAGAEFNTLTVVQADNGAHPVRVYDFLKSIGSRFLQFIPIVEPVARSAREADPGGSPVSALSVTPELWGSFLNSVFDRWLEQDVGEIYVQHFEVLLGMHLGMPASLCVHSPTCGAALAIEHDGAVFSCDHFVDEAHRLGSVLSDSLASMVESTEQLAFGRSKITTLPDTCKACSYLRLCHGGCTKNRLIPTPSGPLNWLCEGYRSFYQHTQPVLRAMGRALRHGRTASDWVQYHRTDATKAE